MEPELTKAQRRRLRELCSVSYERELSKELSNVEAEFAKWRDLQINAFDLSEAIHKFHQDAARELFKKYNYSNVELVVAAALHQGILSKDEVGSDMVERLARFSEILEG